MTAFTMSHTTNKDGEVVKDYTIKANDVPVGTAVKNGAKFDFTPAWENGRKIEGAKTMRDLKVDVEKAIPDGWVEKNKPVKAAKPESEAKAKTKAEKAEVSEAAAEAERSAVEAAVNGEAEDIDLD